MADGLFAQYENEYCTKSTDISRKIQALSSLTGEPRLAKQRELDRDVREAEQIIQRMDMEARSFSADRSRALLVKVKEYKADISKLKEDSKKSSGGAGGALSRAELGLSDDYYQTSAGQRDRLLQATDRIGKTGERIQQGRQQLMETEELGVQILQDLQRQRETIVHTRDTLAGVDTNVGRARTVLATMSRRIIQNKAIMYGIVALLLGAIGLVLYFKISK